MRYCTPTVTGLNVAECCAVSKAQKVNLSDFEDNPKFVHNVLMNGKFVHQGPVMMGDTVVQYSATILS